MSEKPWVYVASPYTKGDPGMNVHFQCRVFDRLMNDRLVVPLVPLWTHFQHLVYPRQYQSWIQYDLDLIRRFDACLRLDASLPEFNYFQHESSGADGEVREFESRCKPVFYSIEDLYGWVRSRP